MKTPLLVKAVYLLGQILPAVMKNGIRALLEVSLCYQDCFIIGLLSITSRFMARLEHEPTPTTGSRPTATHKYPYLTAAGKYGAYAHILNTLHQHISALPWRYTYLRTEYLVTSEFVDRQDGLSSHVSVELNKSLK
jgi:hypothetical protein